MNWNKSTASSSSLEGACSAAPFPSGSAGQCHPLPVPSHRHLDLLLEDIDLVLLLNQLLLLLGDLVRHGVDEGITEGPGSPPAPAPAYL